MHFDKDKDDNDDDEKNTERVYPCPSPPGPCSLFLPKSQCYAYMSLLPCIALHYIPHCIMTLQLLQHQSALNIDKDKDKVTEFEYSAVEFVSVASGMYLLLSRFSF